MGTASFHARHMIKEIDVKKGMARLEYIAWEWDEARK